MSRLLGFLWLLLVLGVGALPLRAQPLPDRAPLRGVVVDQDGKPVAGVYLALRRQNGDGPFAFWGAETASDAEGNFSFANAEEGEYYLNAEMSGFAPVLNRVLSWARRGTPQRIQLTRLASVQLRFLSTEGTPLMQKPVFARLQRATGETFVYQLRTDDKGVAFVPNVVAATYTVWAHNSEGYATQILELRYAPAPQALDVRLQKGGTLDVTARDATGASLGGASFSLSPASPDEALRLGSANADVNDEFALLAAEGDRAAIVTRDGDGSIELHNLPPGRYAARMSLPGFTAFAPRIIDVQAGKNIPLQWSFATRRASSLTLDLRTSDDKPLANREVTVRILPINTNGTLARENVDANGQAMPFFPSGAGVRRAVSDAQGRLQLFPLRPGRYRVFAAPLAKNTSGTPAKESSPLDLDVGESGATANIVLP